MPFMAGAGRVPYLRFAFYNTLGCILWATIFVVLGYFFGQSWELLHRWAGRAGAVLGAFVLFLLALGWIWGWIARNEMELRMRWSTFLQRPRVAGLSTRVTQRVDLLCKRLTPAGYLALHLVAGAFVIILVSWSFGAIASNAEGHHYLLAADHKIFSWFQEHSTRPLIHFAASVSRFGSATVLTIASFATSLFLLWRRSWHRLLMLLLAVGGGGALCVLLRIFHWTLPLPENPFAALPSDTFPSWHAMGSILFYGLLAVFIGAGLKALRWRALTFFIACVVVLLIALTRIYLGAHYVTDVIGAIVAGLAWLVWLQIGVALMRRNQHALNSESSSSASS